MRLMRIVLTARTSERTVCSATVASAAGFAGTDLPAAGFPNAASTSSRTHSPGVTPWAAAKDSSCAYSSSLSLVPTERVRRKLLWLEPCGVEPLGEEPGTAVG